MPKVSVIVPIYNVEAYLSRCVESILGQTLKDIEVILVDDGSPDNCGMMADTYAAQDSRIVVIHQPNGGLATARNAGLAIASGEYIGFVDSDDWAEPAMFEVLYSCARDHNADLTICNYNRVYDEQAALNHCLNIDYDLYIDIKKIGIDEYFRQYYYTYKFGFNRWNKLYRKDLIVSNNISFDSIEHMGEDLLFNLFYLPYVKSVYYTNQSLYNYYIRHTSMVNTYEQRRHLQLMKLYEKFYDYLTSYDLLDNCRSTILPMLFCIHLIGGLNISIREGLSNTAAAEFLAEVFQSECFCNTCPDRNIVRLFKQWRIAERMKSFSTVKFAIFSLCCKYRYYRMAVRILEL